MDWKKAIDKKMNVLKRLRTEKGISLRKLAARANLDQSTISQLENDHKKAMLLTLYKLSRALEVPVEDLLELHDNGAAARGQKGAAARLVALGLAPAASGAGLAEASSGISSGLAEASVSDVSDVSVSVSGDIELVVAVAE
ncbi:MAG: helix-turn-helix transcriptional regulator [Chloroflexi bacterium]|nr:helix-turn-helix transcriptional regulator [Chloroflexota bacterium]